MVSLDMNGLQTPKSIVKVVVSPDKASIVEVGMSALPNICPILVVHILDSVWRHSQYNPWVNFTGYLRLICLQSTHPRAVVIALQDCYALVIKQRNPFIR